MKPALMRHVLWPLITFPELPEQYDLERGVSVELRLLGLIPLWTHTIRVVHLDREARIAVTEEQGGPVRRWRHHLSAEVLTADRCRYTDHLEIDAGAVTAMSRVIARGLYAHRHRRWRALARVLA